MAASWVGKAPADMTNDELAAAKKTVYDELVPTQDRLNALSAAVSNLDWEINSRYRMVATPPPATSLPTYPLAYLEQEFGTTK